MESRSSLGLDTFDCVSVGNLIKDHAGSEPLSVTDVDKRDT